MAKEVDLKTIISNLAKLGVSATMTKSRLEMLKALAPPAHDPQISVTIISKSDRLFHAARFEQYPKASVGVSTEAFAFSLFVIIGTKHIRPMMEFHTEHESNREHIPHQ